MKHLLLALMLLIPINTLASKPKEADCKEIKQEFLSHVTTELEPGTKADIKVCSKFDSDGENSLYYLVTELKSKSQGHALMIFYFVVRGSEFKMVERDMLLADKPPPAPLPGQFDL